MGCVPTVYIQDPNVQEVVVFSSSSGLSQQKSNHLVIKEDLFFYTSDCRSITKESDPGSGGKRKAHA